MWKKFFRLDNVNNQILSVSNSGDKSANQPYTPLSPPPTYDWIFRGSFASGEMPPLLRSESSPEVPFMAEETPQNDVPTKLKCVLVGDGAVGKTSLIVSYTTNGYPTEYVPTAFDNYNVVVTVDNQPIRIQLCDTAGQDDFDNLRPLCYPGCDVFMVCFSVVSPTSFYNVRDKWIPELKLHSPNTPILLIGTQSDLRTDVKVLIDLAQYREQPVSEETARKMVQQIGATHYVECSALTQKNLKEVFDQAIMLALEGPPLARTSSRRSSKKKKSISSQVSDQVIDYGEERQRKRGWRKMCCLS